MQWHWTTTPTHEGSNMESVENVLPEGVKLEDVLSVLKVAVAGIGLISALSAFS
ncbi:hypothetical protein RQCS_37230 [Rhodococcus qingshengii]|nr:hypothetical protein RE2895_37870 [Rhodococcus erythropolis]BCF84178.1 hypothetical protein RQCS_37230 [Rhodococcus qingshengii]